MVGGCPQVGAIGLDDHGLHSIFALGNVYVAWQLDHWVKGMIFPTSPVFFNFLLNNLRGRQFGLFRNCLNLCTFEDTSEPVEISNSCGLNCACSSVFERQSCATSPPGPRRWQHRWMIWGEYKDLSKLRTSSSWISSFLLGYGCDSRMWSRYPTVL